MNIWQLSSNFRRDPSGKQTVLDEVKNPPKTFVTTKVYLTLRAEATSSSYNGNDKTSQKINSFKGRSKLINHSSQAWRKPFDSLLTHFETFGRMGAPVEIPMGRNIIFLESKNKYILDGTHTIFHGLKIDKFQFLCLSGTVS